MYLIIKKIPVNNNNLGGGDINYWKFLLNNKINTDNIIFKNYGLGIFFLIYNLILIL